MKPGDKPSIKTKSSEAANTQDEPMFHLCCSYDRMEPQVSIGRARRCSLMLVVVFTRSSTELPNVIQWSSYTGAGVEHLERWWSQEVRMGAMRVRLKA